MASQDAETNSILLEADGSVAVLTLNRPAARNAIDDSMRADLMAALDHVGARPTRSSALVITGAGKGFCAGGDVRGDAGAPGGAARRGRR